MGHMNNLNICSFSHVRREQTYTSGPERQKCHRSTSHLPHAPPPQQGSADGANISFFLSATSSTKKKSMHDLVVQCVIMTAAQQQQHTNECFGLCADVESTATVGFSESNLEVQELDYNRLHIL